MTDVAPETTPDTKPERGSLPQMAGQILNLIEPKFDRVKEIVAEQEKVSDVGALLSEAIEKSTDKKVVELREKIEQAHEFINTATKSLEATVRPKLNIPSDEAIAKMDEEYKALAKEIDTYGGVFTMETRNVKADLSVYDYFGQLPGVKKSSGAKKGQGQGTSRPRVQKIEYTQDVNGKEGWKPAVNEEGKSTFSILAQALKKDSDGKVDIVAADFHTAWTDQNGKKDWSDLPDVTTFVYQADDKHRWMVRVTK